MGTSRRAGLHHRLLRPADRRPHPAEHPDRHRPDPVDDLNYTYNDVGDITSEADTPAGDPAATDVQCFSYDYLNRLVQAWAQGTAGCASTPSASAEGGAAPYWDTYTYNTIGNLTGITATTPAGAVTTTTDTYPAAGAARPHAITGQAVTAPSGTTAPPATATTPTGTSPPSPAAPPGPGADLERRRAAHPGRRHPVRRHRRQDTSYIYDADGNLLITADPGTTTLYLPDEELVARHQHRHRHRHPLLHHRRRHRRHPHRRHQRRPTSSATSKAPHPSPSTRPPSRSPAATTTPTATPSAPPRRPSPTARKASSAAPPTPPPA